VVDRADDLPDPTSIGTDSGEAGVRQSAEAVRDAFAVRDTARLCALAFESETYPNCPQFLNDAFDDLPAKYVRESRALSFEEVSGLGVTTSLGTPIAIATLVNRDPVAECPSWDLYFFYYDGRWQLDFTFFADRYVRQYDETRETYCFPL
jgi:hypothetical protein